MWFTEEKNKKPVDLISDKNYNGRVEYLSGYNNCTLRIKDLRKSDSAVYKFRFTTNQHTGRFKGDHGVRLFVTGNVSLSTRWCFNAQHVW